MSIEAIKEHLGAISSLLAHQNMRAELKYNSVEEFTLKLGMECKAAPYDERFIAPFRTPKECFKNAILLAVANPELTYVEGYFYRDIIPINHAWCITADGTVVDPTVFDPEAFSYFGVPMQTDFVMGYVMKKGTYGVLDDWTNQFPMLRHDVKEEQFLKVMK